MRAVAGQQIMRKGIDQTENNQHRHPRHPRELSCHRVSKPFHQTEFREISCHVDQHAHPYQYIPCTMLFRNIGPVKDLGQQHSRQAKQGNECRIDMMNRARSPHDECYNKDYTKDLLFDAHLDVDNQYIMSPKDLKTIHFLNKMLDAGVRVLKIEGRARGAEYVKTVVNCYNEAIDSYLDGSFNEDKIQHWDKQLSTVFNRGFWNGYYLGQRLGE